MNTVVTKILSVVFNIKVNINDLNFACYHEILPLNWLSSHSAWFQNTPRMSPIVVILTKQTTNLGKFNQLLSGAKLVSKDMITSSSECKSVFQKLDTITKCQCANFILHVVVQFEMN